jgi:hypothetical protein
VASEALGVRGRAGVRALAAGAPTATTMADVARKTLQRQKPAVVRARDGRLTDTQGLVSDLQIIFPVGPHATGPFLTSRSDEFRVESAPLLLEPGQMRQLSITGTLPLRTMYENGRPPDPQVDRDDLARSGSRKAEVALLIRGLDFQGQKYEARWPLAAFYVLEDTVTGWTRHDDDLKIFDPKYRTSNLPLGFPRSGVGSHTKGPELNK